VKSYGLLKQQITLNDGKLRNQINAKFAEGRSADEDTPKLTANLKSRISFIQLKLIFPCAISVSPAALSTV
jgi:hypothetical protein